MTVKCRYCVAGEWSEVNCHNNVSYVYLYVNERVKDSISVVNNDDIGK